MIRVAIVDDQPLVRAGFAAVIAHVEGLELVGEAADGASGVELVVRARPDVVLMDVRMPKLDGIEATRQILADPRLSAVRVIVLTTFDLDDHVHAALRAGASAFLLKDAPPEALVDAVRVVADGGALLAPTVTRRLIERVVGGGTVDASPLRHLTERERDVLALVGRGRSNTEVAADLHMSVATVKTHVGRLLAKLHARDRAQLVVAAYETGLVRPGHPDASAGDL